MARMKDHKPGSNTVQAKKALLRKITFMKLVQTAQAAALVAIALKYTGLLDSIIPILQQVLNH